MLEKMALESTTCASLNGCELGRRAGPSRVLVPARKETLSPELALTIDSLPDTQLEYSREPIRNNRFHSAIS